MKSQQPKEITQPEGQAPVPPGKAPRRSTRLTVSLAVNIVLVVVMVGVAAGYAVIRQSDTNPNFCATCHIMQPNVTSYLTSSNLDHVHMQAGVQCKDCHDYPLSAEISSGVKFVVGDYTVGSNGQLQQRKYPDAMCTRCHISEAHVAQLTDFLARNPHASHNGDLPCNTCHVSHGQQIDYCSQCHDNGGQRMIGQPIQSRGTISH